MYKLIFDFNVPIGLYNIINYRYTHSSLTAPEQLIYSFGMFGILVVV